MKRNAFVRFIRYFLGFLGLVGCLGIILAASIYLYNVFTSQNHEEIETSYNTTSNIDYLVYMKNNEFIPDKYLGMDKSYIAKLVDNVASDFSFVYTNENSDEITYSYVVRGILTGSYSDETGSGDEVPIWQETTILKESDDVITDSTDISLEEQVTTNIETVTNRVRVFQEEFGIPIKANYKIEMKVSLDFNIDDNKVSKSHGAYLNIPLNTDVFSIEKVVESNVTTDIVKEVDKKELNKPYLILAVTLLALALISIISIFRYVFVEPENEYEKELKEIIKLYGDRIVSVENIVRKEGTEFIDLLGFEELVELTNELNLPILCWKRKNHKETWFCAIKDDITYRYLVKN